MEISYRSKVYFRHLLCFVFRYDQNVREAIPDIYGMYVEKVDLRIAQS